MVLSRLTGEITLWNTLLLDGMLPLADRNNDTLHCIFMHGEI